jgi:hypothetical protein
MLSDTTISPIQADRVARGSFIDIKGFGKIARNSHSQRGDVMADRITWI